ncbi:IPT/TIG domain-containing protein [Patescibacteria group bacterium]|nr:IPT/TIG domain-containing protein [Patescibacteria group bacterium]
MKKILSIILASLYLVSLPVLVNAQAAVGRPGSMYYNPGTSTVTLNSSGEFSASVMANTGGADAVATDSIVTFDTTKLAFVSGTYPASTTFFPNGSVVGMPSASSANASGRISLARAIPAPAPGEGPVYTNGSGTIATLTFKPLTGVTSATLSFDFTLGSSTDSNIAGTVANSDILGSVTPATYTFIAGGGGTSDNDPYITTIIPEEGDEDTETELIIEGGNFGVEDGKVYIGTRLADIIAWSNEEITVVVPAISVSKDTQYQVKVRRTDGKIATYMGFTIVDTGLAAILWMGLIPLNGAAAILVKRRWFSKRQLETVSIPIQVIQ